MAARPQIALVWDNFGPLHDDRCAAVATALPDADIVGIELGSESDTYSWQANALHGPLNLRKITLFPGARAFEQPKGKLFARLVRALWPLRGQTVILCHYERPAILFAAIVARMIGCRVYTMGCSKFDDYERHVLREAFKRLFFLPYQGALSSHERPIDYLRYLGLPRERLASGYNSVSIDRFRSASGAPPAPDGAAHGDRHFIIVARLVEKKNISVAINAYARYAASAPRPRRLLICGDGPLEADLRAQAEALGVADQIEFRGFVQSEEVARLYATSLALILPSITEQFGNVVVEAMATGLPVILSINCGARELLVQSGVNGFVFEPDNPAGLAFFMGLIDRDPVLWADMARAAVAAAPRGDVAEFARGVAQLAGLTVKS